jgi:hypothetical protein
MKVRELTVKLYEIEKHGLPPRDEDGDLLEEYVGRVAFLWDGNLVNGWALDRDDDEDADELPLWEPSEIGEGRSFAGVTHWLHFPEAFWDMERNDALQDEAQP